MNGATQRMPERKQGISQFGFTRVKTERERHVTAIGAKKQARKSRLLRTGGRRLRCTIRSRPSAQPKAKISGGINRALWVAISASRERSRGSPIASPRPALWKRNEANPYGAFPKD